MAVRTLLALPVGFVSRITLSHPFVPRCEPSHLDGIFNGSGATGEKAIQGPHAVLGRGLVR